MHKTLNLAKDLNVIIDMSKANLPLEFSYTELGRDKISTQILQFNSIRVAIMQASPKTSVYSALLKKLLHLSKIRSNIFYSLKMQSIG